MPCRETAGAHVALVAWHRRDLHPLTPVPGLDLVALVAGLPVRALVAGWLLAGRELPFISRQPMG